MNRDDRLMVILAALVAAIIVFLVWRGEVTRPPENCTYEHPQEMTCP